MSIARRLSIPHFIIDRAIRSPPRKRKMSLFAYCASAVSRGRMPSTGRRTAGMSDVA